MPNRPIPAALLALLVVLASCGQATPTSTPTAAPRGTPTQEATASPAPSASSVSALVGRIAFRRFFNADQSSGAIFIINPDGTGLRQLTHNAAAGSVSVAATVANEPNWSLDGRWIVYMLEPNGDPDAARLRKIRADGSGDTTLAGTCTGACLSDGFPAWSPSGSLIAFQRALGPAAHANNFSGGIEHDWFIYVMNADGTNARRITQPQASSRYLNRYADLAPTFAPSGLLIAFERYDQKTNHHAVFTVHLDGSGLRQVTPWALDASQPDYSPDGEWILFRSNETSDTEGNVWLVHPDGTGLHAVTHSAAGTAKWLSGSFSPDGLYISDGRAPVVTGQQQNADVWVMHLDGSGLRNVTDNSNFWDSAPDWGPAL